MDLRKHENFAKTLKNLFGILSNTVRIPTVNLHCTQEHADVAAIGADVCNRCSCGFENRKPDAG